MLDGIVGSLGGAVQRYPAEQVLAELEAAEDAADEAAARADEVMRQERKGTVREVGRSHRRSQEEAQNRVSRTAAIPNWVLPAGRRDHLCSERLDESLQRAHKWPGRNPVRQFCAEGTNKSM